MSTLQPTYIWYIVYAFIRRQRPVNMCVCMRLTRRNERIKQMTVRRNLYSRP